MSMAAFKIGYMKVNRRRSIWEVFGVVFQILLGEKPSKSLTRWFDSNQCLSELQMCNNRRLAVYRPSFACFINLNLCFESLFLVAWQFVLEAGFTMSKRSDVSVCCAYGIVCTTSRVIDQRNFIFDWRFAFYFLCPRPPGGVRVKRQFIRQLANPFYFLGKWLVFDDTLSRLDLYSMAAVYSLLLSLYSRKIGQSVKLFFKFSIIRFHVAGEGSELSSSISLWLLLFAPALEERIWCS